MKSNKLQLLNIRLHLPLPSTGVSKLTENECSISGKIYKIPEIRKHLPAIAGASNFWLNQKTMQSTSSP